MVGVPSSSLTAHPTPPCSHLNKPRDVASGQNPRSCTSSPKLPTASFSCFSHDQGQLISSSPPRLSLSFTTLYHANRRSPPPPSPFPPRLDIHLHEGAIVVDDRREISSPPSRGTSRPLVTNEGAKTCPVAERGTRMARWGRRAERGKRHLLPLALPRVSLRGGLTPCVGATRIPSGSGREEEEDEGGCGKGERERETSEGRAGPLGGVKRLTVCYHGNATPLRQEESLNPARYGPCQLSLSVHPINGALSCPRERAKGGERRRGGPRPVEGEDARGWGWWRPDYATNSVFTPKCFHRALPIYRVVA